MIYPLPPEELDDKTLDKQIKAIAQTLCMAHHRILALSGGSLTQAASIPLQTGQVNSDYSKWASECRANYSRLVDMGQQGCIELNYRGEGLTQKQIEIEKILLWARDNVPNLGIKYEEIGHGYRETETPFPLVMPEEYIVYLPGPCRTIISDENESYRNYYRDKVPKDAKWTRREKPPWL